MNTTDLPKKKNNGYLIAVIIPVILFVILIVIVICSGNSTDNTGGTTTPGNSNIQQGNDDSTDYPVIYEDAQIKASYIKVDDIDYIEGAVYLYLLVENKSNKEIVVGTHDTSINSMSTLAMGNGALMPIAAGNSSQQPFTILLGNTSVTKASDIKRLQFKIGIYDNDNWSMLSETPEIEITLK